jgi:hypothetical protein
VTRTEPHCAAWKAIKLFESVVLEHSGSRTYPDKALSSRHLASYRTAETMLRRVAEVGVRLRAPLACTRTIQQSGWVSQCRVSPQSTSSRRTLLTSRSNDGTDQRWGYTSQRTAGAVAGAMGCGVAAAAAAWCTSSTQSAQCEAAVPDTTTAPSPPPMVTLYQVRTASSSTRIAYPTLSHSLPVTE